MKTLAILTASIFYSTFTLRSSETAPIMNAVAVLHPTTGQQCDGIVRFSQEGDSVKVVADIEGLTPGQKDAFHIHQYGDCSASDGMSEAGHYNPNPCRERSGIGLCKTFFSNLAVCGQSS